MSPTPLWLSLPDAAAWADVDVETLRVAICHGELHPRKFGMTTKVVDAELVRWAQRREFRRPVRSRVAAGSQRGATGTTDRLDQFSVDAWLRQTSVPGQSAS